MPQIIGRTIFLLTVFLIVAPQISQADTMGLVDTGRLPSGQTTQIWSLSADGTVGAGTSGSGTARRAIRYTSAGGVQDLGLLGGLSTSGAAFSYAFGTAVSFNGQVIVGKLSDSGGVGQGFYWTEEKGMQGLGYLRNGISSVAYAVSQDGRVIAGTANDGSDGQNEKAVLWSGTSKTIQTLGLGRITNDGLNASPYPTAISGDGSLIVGYATNNTDTYAWMWSQNDANISKFMPDSYSKGYSDTAGLSFDGHFIVGTVSTSNDQNNLRAYSYEVSNKAMTLLGVLNNSSGSKAYSYGLAISKDGSVIVGQASDGANSNRDAAYRWTAARGMETIEQWLTRIGLAVSSSSAYTQTANSVSADGCVVGGQLSNGNGFIAKGCQGLGLVDVSSFQNSLTTTKQTVVNTQLVHSDIILNGLNGQPLALRTEAGRWSVGVSGDLGGSDGSAFSANKLGELLLAYGLEHDITFKIGLGSIDVSQNTFQKGSLDSRGVFVTPELVARIAQTPLYFSLLGVYQTGTLNLKRGYDNAGTQAYSEGKTQTRFYGGRIRVDWLNAIQIGQWSATPHVSLSAMRTEIDTYSETGNSFPVTWKAHYDDQTLIRLGLESRYVLTDSLTLNGKLEAVHRFESQSRSAQGSLIGVGDFATTPTPYQQNWMRYGLGFDLKAGWGTASVMVNKYTGLLNPYWVNVGYKLTL
jgi:uncharacterized membrane protein